MKIVRIAVLIPTMNEEAGIKHTIDMVQALRMPLDIYILDASIDNTPSIVKELGDEYNNIQLVPRLRPELGEAIKLGLSIGIEHNPSYDYLITMDSDMSHHPRYIPRMLAKAKEGYDHIIGSRYIKGGGIIGWTTQRKITSWGANSLARIILGVKTLDNTTNFRCFSYRIAKLILPQLKTSGFGIFPEISFRVQKSGFKMTEIPITFKDREIGESKLVGGEYFKFLRMLWDIRCGKAIKG